MLNAPAAPIARTIASTRPSHSAVKHRLVRLRLDLAETVHAAHVVDAVHDGAPGVFGKSGADHRVARDQLGELLLAPALGALRAASAARGSASRRSNPTRGSRSPSAASTPKSAQHAARVLHGARAIRRGLVPDRRQAEHFPRVAGAQRADDHVVALRRVLDRHQMVADAADMAERARRPWSRPPAAPA